MFKKILSGDTGSVYLCWCVCSTAHLSLLAIVRWNSCHVAPLCMRVCACWLHLIVPAGNGSRLACAAAIVVPVCLGAAVLHVCIYIHVYAYVFGCHYLFSLACFLKVASSQPGDEYNSVCVCACVFAWGNRIQSKHTWPGLFPRWSWMNEWADSDIDRLTTIRVCVCVGVCCSKP